MFLDKTEEILIRTRRNVFGQNSGNTHSIFSGNGLDFKELREYNIGDDVRKINWKVTAKSQEPHVNLFNEERELNIVLAVLISGSLYFGSVRFKQELVGEIMALLSYSALKNDDRLTSLLYSDREEFFLPPTKKMGSLHLSLEKVLGMDLLEKSNDYEGFVHYINSHVKQKSLIFVIGDFYGDIDFSLLNRHEVYAIMVRDRFEESPKLFGEMELLDPNTMQESDLLLNQGVLKKFEKEVKLADEKLYEHFERYRIRHVKIYTDEEPFVKLNALFKGV